MTVSSLGYTEKNRKKNNKKDRSFQLLNLGYIENCFEPNGVRLFDTR